MARCLLPQGYRLSRHCPRAAVSNPQGAVSFRAAPGSPQSHLPSPKSARQSFIELPDQLLRGFPADTAIGDGAMGIKSSRVPINGLLALFQMAFQHHCEQALVSGLDLLQDGLQHLRLTAVILIGVVMTDRKSTRLNSSH